MIACGEQALRHQIGDTKRAVRVRVALECRTSGNLDRRGVQAEVDATKAQELGFDCRRDIIAEILLELVLNCRFAFRYTLQPIGWGVTGLVQRITFRERQKHRQAADFAAISAALLESFDKALKVLQRLVDHNVRGIGINNQNQRIGVANLFDDCAA